MLNFLIFLDLGAYEISCSVELSTKKVIQSRALVFYGILHRNSCKETVLPRSDAAFWVCTVCICP